jgi:hypothetical protein
MIFQWSPKIAPYYTILYYTKHFDIVFIPPAHTGSGLNSSFAAESSSSVTFSMPFTSGT